MSPEISRDSSFHPFFVVVLLLGFASSGLSDWKIDDQSPAQPADALLINQQKVISRPGETGFFSTRRIDLVWFNAADFTFKVIDNQSIERPLYPGLAAAMRSNGCVLGCNGGFFHPDSSPSGLMVSGAKIEGKFGEGALLSGVLLSSGNRNPYLLRRSEYGASKYKPTDLIQAGPFLVDQGITVRGLSPENSRRRTFVLHDGGKWFALALSDPFTLAELGQILADPAFSPSRKVFRALNLDGGSSSGLFFDRGRPGEKIESEPVKTVRNFIGIVPRSGTD